jgi:hypothetical protein
MSTKDITRLARRFNTLDPEKVETLTVPGEPTMINGASVIQLDKTQSQMIVDRLNGKIPPPPAPADEPETPPTTVVKPSEVDVRVLNGNGTAGAAKKTADELQTAGYSVAGTGDTASAAKTVIRYSPGEDDSARQLREGLRSGATLQEDESLTSVDAVLIIGADYTGLREGVGPTTTVSTIVPSPVPQGAPPPPPC